MRARGTILVGFIQAAEQIWGKPGLAQIAARLPTGARRDTIEQGAVALEWFPEQYVLDWYRAVWEGPAAEDKDVFFTFLHRMMDAGFGRIRKALLALANPALVIDRAEALWRHDHSHGQIKAELAPWGATVRLIDHPYVDDPLAAMAIAEIYRYVVMLCRVKTATETHRRDPSGTLLVQLRWSK